MYILKIVADVALAALAVFGTYALLRLCILSRLSPASMGVSIEIGEGIGVEDVPLLMARARDRVLWSGGRIVALILPETAANTALLEALRAHGAVLCITDKES